MLEYFPFYIIGLSYITFTLMKSYYSTASTTFMKCIILDNTNFVRTQSTIKFNINNFIENSSSGMYTLKLFSNDMELCNILYNPELNAIFTNNLDCISVKLLNEYEIYITSNTEFQEGDMLEVLVHKSYN